MENYKFIIVVLLAIFIMLFVYIFSYAPYSEHFEMLIGDDNLGLVSRVNLVHFFQFVDYFQATDLNKDDKQESINSETDYIKNNILLLLKMLHFIILNNDEDNYYSRYVVMKNNNSTHLQVIPDHSFPKLVRTIDLDPNNISVHNYYTQENVNVNLLALKMLLELIHHNDPNEFKGIYLPSELPVFNTEFMVPLKIIKRSILHIVNTKSYKEFLKTEKYSEKYKDLVFMIDEEI